MKKSIVKAHGGREIERFEPDRHRLRVAAVDFTIKEAKRIKDWGALEKAIDVKIDEQRQFIAWWKATVATGHGAGRGNKNNRERGSFSMREAERLTGMVQQRVSDLAKALGKLSEYRDRLLGVEYQAAYLKAKDVRGTQGTGENEWHTPEQYLDLARAVLGEIDLDPASHEIAQKRVRAKKYFTLADNGLEQEWCGRIWLNPPYAQPLIANFIDKLIAELEAGRASAAIALTHNYTDTAWFQNAGTLADAICFTRGRVRFIDTDGGLAAPTQGQAFHYFGENAAKFIAEFASVGLVVVRPCSKK